MKKILSSRTMSPSSLFGHGHVHFSLFTFFFLLITEFTIAQQQEIKNLPLQSSAPLNFYTIQENFYNHYGIPTVKQMQEELNGESDEEESYYNQFKRWEYLMESRTFPTGLIPDPSIAHSEFEAYKMAHPELASIRTATWEPVGSAAVPGNGGGVGRINVIRFDPANSNTIYIGAAGGGVWKSTNSGSNWTDLTSSIPVTSIADIAIDPSNSNIVYIATGDGYGYEATWQSDNDFWGGVYSAGILKSVDGGISWTTTGLSYSQNNKEIIQRLVIHPSNPLILLASTRGGIYRTVDGGINWSLVDATHCFDMEFNTANPNTIYAGGNQDILQSTDAGATWTVLKNNLCGAGRISIETTAANPLVIYALCVNGTLSRSADGGATWVTKSSPSGAATFYGYYDLVLECADANADNLLAGGLYVAKSTNGGTSWQTISSWSPYTAANYVHADNHDLKFLPGSTQTIFSGNDGGIFKSVNQGTSWTDLSSGLRLAQIYRLSTSATNPSIVYSGWQDNGSNRWDGTSYTQVYGADGMEALVDYTNSNIVFIETQYGSIYKSTNGGSSFTYVAPSSGPWVTTYIMDPVDHNKMYAGYATLYKSTNNGSNWSVLASNLYGGNYCTAIAVAPSNTNTIYTSSLGLMKKTTNGAAPFTDITAGLPVASAGINYIAVSNTDPNSVWVAFSGYSSGNKVFKSTNGGSSWTNVSGTLPNLPVNTIVYENGSSNRVYIGTDIGVYYRDDNTADWIFYNDGLPNVMVHELEINYTSDKLVAATYGRGIWQSDLASNAPTASITTTPFAASTFCPGENITVAFTAMGSYDPANNFIAQLSSSTGSFSSPTVIGSIVGTSSGNINAAIPSTASGTGYRIRVIATNPATTGTDNGSDLLITCPVPSNLSTANISASGATLNWQPASCTSDYQLQYKVSTSTVWTKVNSSGSTLPLTGLQSNTKYKWKLKTKCVGSNPKVFSPFSAVSTFTTATIKTSGAVASTPDRIQVYPNPFNNAATVQFQVQQSTNMRLELLDAQGKVALQLYNGIAEAGTFQATLQRNQLPAGVYLLQMVTSEEVVTKKVIIE
ncbi:MAG: T9SS type A sorting domain-containing protein [Chitinophagaceae bacterium]|nr:T9SS type A sorting domain-containing protein [Chitinophagaceae bacterium]